MKCTGACSFSAAQLFVRWRLLLNVINFFTRSFPAEKFLYYNLRFYESLVKPLALRGEPVMPVDSVVGKEFHHKFAVNGLCASRLMIISVAKVQYNASWVINCNKCPPFFSHSPLPPQNNENIIDRTFFHRRAGGTGSKVLPLPLHGEPAYTQHKSTRPYFVRFLV